MSGDRSHSPVSDGRWSFCFRLGPPAMHLGAVVVEPGLLAVLQSKRSMQQPPDLRQEAGCHYKSRRLQCAMAHTASVRQTPKRPTARSVRSKRPTLTTTGCATEAFAHTPTVPTARRSRPILGSRRILAAASPASNVCEHAHAGFVPVYIFGILWL